MTFTGCGVTQTEHRTSFSARDQQLVLIPRAAELDWQHPVLYGSESAAGHVQKLIAAIVELIVFPAELRGGETGGSAERAGQLQISFCTPTINKEGPASAQCVIHSRLYFII